MKYIKIVLFALTMALVTCKPPKSPVEVVKIIPKPVDVVYNGKKLLIKNGIRIGSNIDSLDFLISMLRAGVDKLPHKEYFSPERFPVDVILKIDDDLKHPEGYRLTVGKNKIEISANNPIGLVYGIQTLLQVFMQAKVYSGTVEIPQLSVRDYPRFAYRGMHLDVSRHFFDISFVKKYIDLIVMHKMNTFHWHLTDDQGWRIEIKKYPKLTEIGAWRVNHEDMDWNNRPDQTEKDSIFYGGFYTQEQIKEVVAYAAERGVSVIPEIEMPGHSAAAIASYPELSCSGTKTTVPSGGDTGPNILCAGKENTFTFIEDVLTEVMSLFPSKYIHIGGDEANKPEWRRCPYCRARIDEHGLVGEEQLQSYFIQRVDSFLTSKGRNLIGWDEIIEGGLAKNAAVMSWRGTSGGIQAARLGHDVVMTPVEYCYFDYYQDFDKSLEPIAFNGFINLEKVYSFEPVHRELAMNRNHILGAQGNVWTEFITDEKIAYLRVLPRMTALSEVLWSADKEEFAAFLQKLEPFLKWISVNDYSYHIPAPEGVFKEMIFIDSLSVSLVNPWPFSQIRYTLDGSDPDDKSAVYTNRIFINKPVVLKTALFVDGIQGPIRTSNFTTAEPIEPYEIDTTDLKSGIVFKYYEVSIDRVGAIQKYKPDNKGIMFKVDLPDERRKEVFALEFSGYVKIPETGIYSFKLASDDGSVFYVGEHLVIDHDGYHSSSDAFGQIALKPGYYPVYLGYFDGGGGNSLDLQFHNGDGLWKKIPSSILYHYD